LNPLVEPNQGFRLPRLDDEERRDLSNNPGGGGIGPNERVRRLPHRHIPGDIGHRAAPTLPDFLQHRQVGVVNAEPYAKLGRAVPSRNAREAEIPFSIHETGKILSRNHNID
jgi:hypothetical protein